MKTKRERRIAMLLAALMLIINLGISPVWAEGSVEINEENFPDPIFRQYIKETLDKDNNGVLDSDELDYTYVLDLQNKNISSFKGIEYFSNLESLQFNNNNVRDLDVSKNLELIKLWCKDNQLTSLDVSKNRKLKDLRFSNNYLTEIDVSNNQGLERIDCVDNQLHTLDLSNKSNLKRAYCGRNKLSYLNLLNCTSLYALWCQANQLTTLDLTDNHSLRDFDCEANQLTNLDLTSNTQISSYYIGMQKYSIAVDENNLTFNLGSLPGNFDSAKTSDWVGGTVSGNILTLDSSKPGKVTYRYEAQPGKKMDVTLNVSYGEVVSITFDSNGGYGNMENTSVTKGSSYTLPNCIFTPPVDKEFKAWEVDGNEKQPGDTITVNADVNVKALWKEKTVPPTGDVTVTFDKNGGTGTMESKTLTAGSTYILPSCTFTAPDGKKFKAWKVGNEEKNVGDSIKVNEDTTVVAIWKNIATVESLEITSTEHKTVYKVDEPLDLYYLSMDAIMSDGTRESVIVTEDMVSGFDTTTEGTKTLTITYEGKTVSYDITVIPRQYVIRFDANGEHGSMKSVFVDKGTVYPLPACEFYSSFKEFKAWEVDGVEKQPGDSITVTTDVNVKAIWKAKKATVTFDPNEGSGNIPSQTVDDGSSIVLPECTFTPPNGYEFNYWQAYSEKYHPGDSLQVIGDTLVKAIWKKFL